MHDWRKRTRDPFETIYNWPIANEVGGGGITHKFWINHIQFNEGANYTYLQQEM